MSVEAISWAFQQGDLPTGAKFLLVAIANAADKSGIAWVGQATLAADCSCSTRSVRENLKRLEEAGALARRERLRRNGSRTSDWLVLAPTSSTRVPMLDASPDELPQEIAALARKGAEESSGGGGRIFRGGRKKRGGPDPSVDPLNCVSARADARLTFSGKPVKSEAWALTERVLAEFNAQAGRKYRLLTSSGELSEASKRIYGRVVRYPDLEFEDHADIIRRTLLSKWWLRGKKDTGEPPAIGVVYGPNVFEDNITRPGSPENAAAEEKRERARRDREAIQRILRRSQGEET